MGRGAWRATVHGVARAGHGLVTKPSPPAGLLRASSIGSAEKNPPAMQETRVRSLDGKIPWRRKRQPAPVFLHGEFREQRSLADYSP